MFVCNAVVNGWAARRGWLTAGTADRAVALLRAVIEVEEKSLSKTSNDESEHESEKKIV